MVTGLPDAIPYVPTFHRTLRGATKQKSALSDSFAPGMVRIEIAKRQRRGFDAYRVIVQSMRGNAVVNRRG